MNVDLNEENYDYEGLLDLFSLPHDFNHQHLKQAKKKVLLLHPDKSHLEEKYFLFFRKMYQKIEEIYKFSHHETNIHQFQKQIDIETHFKDYLEKNNINPKTNYKKFTEEFNRMFTHVYVNDDEYGYENWFKSDENMYDKDDLEKSKQEAIKDQIVHIQNEIEGVGDQKKHGLIQYDLKESHSQPFIAMDVDDVYNKHKKFSSVQELQQYQQNQDYTYMSDAQNESYLNQKEALLNQQSKVLAYQHLKAKEKSDQKYQKYVMKYLSLEN